MGIQTRSELGRTPEDDPRAMTLLDTNVVIDARDKRSPFHERAEQLIAESLVNDGHRNQRSDFGGTLCGTAVS